MVQAAEAIVRAVLFLRKLVDSWNSSVFASALVFLDKVMGFCVGETLVFLSDSDELPRPQARKTQKRFNQPFCLFLRLLSRASLSMFLERRAVSCKKESRESRGTLESNDLRHSTLYRNKD